MREIVVDNFAGGAVEQSRDLFKAAARHNDNACQAAKRERDAERAHNAVLRGALKNVAGCSDHWDGHGAQWNVNRLNLTFVGTQQALSGTPSDSAAKVQGLVDALNMLVDTMDDQLSDGGYIAELGMRIDPKMEPWDSLFDARKKARQALAEWSGEK